MPGAGAGSAEQVRRGAAGFPQTAPAGPGTALSALTGKVRGAWGGLSLDGVPCPALRPAPRPPAPTSAPPEERHPVHSLSPAL